MHIEHIAFNVEDSEAMAEWYCANLGMRIVRRPGGPARIHFLADGAGTTVIELYSNPAAKVPDYASMDPLILHIAFTVDDIAAERTRLVAVGATACGDTTITPAGDQLAYLRDPWGLTLQLAKRVQPIR